MSHQQSGSLPQSEGDGEKITEDRDESCVVRRKEPSWLCCGLSEVFNSPSSPSSSWHVGRPVDGWWCSPGEAHTYILWVDFLFASSREQGDLFGRMVMKVGRRWLDCSFCSQYVILTFFFSSWCWLGLFITAYYSLKGGYSGIISQWLEREWQ